jgi:hypothetical protein
MLLAVGTRLDPYRLVTLDTFIQRNPEPIHTLGEVHWLREGQGGQQQEVGIEFIVMQAPQRAQLIEEIYASR